MSAQLHARHNQGPKSNKVFNQYEELQDLIRSQTGIDCSVLVTPEQVSIRTMKYADYILAKSAINSHVSKPIVWDQP